MSRLFKLTVVPLGLVMVSLTGCATMQPVTHTGISPEQQALMDSVQKIEKVSASLRTADTPYKGFPLPLQSNPAASKPDYVSNALNRVINAKWSGRADTLLSGLSQRVGWSFQNRYTGVQPDVTIDMKDAKVVDVLQEVAKQLPADAVISVRSGRIVLSN